MWVVATGTFTKADGEEACRLPETAAPRSRVL